MRRLVTIRIVHSQADLGSMAPVLEKAYIRAHGETRWKAHREKVERFWKALGGRLEGMGLEWPKVRIYQDGLPVCGRERALVERIAGQGSLNHRLILKLLERGASLEGTEDPELLLEEHRSLQELSRRWRADSLGRLSPSEKEHRRGLLERRDAFIARRICATLGPAETGLLFIGAGHSPQRHLPKGISLSVLPA